jgi:hypothetical protein
VSLTRTFGSPLANPSTPIATTSRERASPT